MSDTLKQALLPKEGKVSMKDGLVTGVILDAELDPIECDFNYDECVTINTKDLNEIKLDFSTLQTLMDMIEDAEKLYEKNLED